MLGYVSLPEWSIFTFFHFFQSLASAAFPPDTSFPIKVGFGVRKLVNESMPNCFHDTCMVCGDVWEAPFSHPQLVRPTAPKRYCLELPPHPPMIPVAFFQVYFEIPYIKMLPHKSGWFFEPASWGPGERGKSFGKISQSQPPLRLVARAAVWLLCYEILGSKHVGLNQRF